MSTTAIAAQNQIPGQLDLFLGDVETATARLDKAWSLLRPQRDALDSDGFVLLAALESLLMPNGLHDPDDTIDVEAERIGDVIWAVVDDWKCPCADCSPDYDCYWDLHEEAWELRPRLLELAAQDEIEVLSTAFSDTGVLATAATLFIAGR